MWQQSFLDGKHYRPAELTQAPGGKNYYNGEATHSWLSFIRKKQKNRKKNAYMYVRLAESFNPRLFFKQEDKKSEILM